MERNRIRERLIPWIIVVKTPNPNHWPSVCIDLVSWMYKSQNTIRQQLHLKISLNFILQYLLQKAQLYVKTLCITLHPECPNPETTQATNPKTLYPL